MSSRNWREVVAGAAATVALLAIVIGIPVALITAVGWPLPHDWPTTTQVGRALTGKDPVDPSVWVRLLACVLWVAWIRVTATIAVEVAATTAGRVRHARGSALQLGIGRLVATAALLLSLTTSPRHAPPLTVRPIVATADVAPPQPSGVTLTTTDRAAPPNQWTVARRETLWGIAERTLGDGSRYREIFDLNRNRTQADGGRLSNPDRLQTGWTLLLPDDATNLPGNSEVIVRSGDTLSGIAQRELGDANRYPELFTANEGRPQPDGSALETPNLIRPGWHLHLPGAPAEQSAPPPASAPAEPSAPPPPDASPAPPAPAESALTPPTSEAPTAPLAPQTRTDNTPAHGRDLGTVALVGGLSVATAAGLLWRLRHLRQARAQRRRPDTRAPAVDTNTARAERDLSDVADDETARWLAATNRYLTGALGSFDEPPTPILLRVGRRGIEILLDRDAAPPPGFVIDDDPTAWRLDPTVDLDELEQQASAIPALGALITVGVTPEGPVLLNLEHAARLAVTGDPERVRAYLAGVALELGSAPWADTTLTLLADLDLDPAGLTLSRIVDEAHATKTIIEHHAHTAASLNERTTLTARTRTDAPELWAPTVALLAATPDEPRHIDELRTHGGSAVVAAGPIHESDWTLHISTDGFAHLTPIDLTLSAVGIDDTTADNVATLLADHANPSPAHASTNEDQALHIIDLTTNDNGARADATANNGNGSLAPVTRRVAEQVQEILAARDVEVCILTPTPTVTGWADTEGLRNKSIEMVVFLATAGAPVRMDRLLELWHGDIAPATVKSAIARTRTALGDDATGARHFPDATPQGTYHLGPNVGCDWTRFTALVDLARDAAPDDAITALTAALGLVQGRPFTHVPPRGHYRWVEINNFLYNIEAVITDAAHRLAVLAIDAGDIELATWATDQGHLVTPGQLSLFEDRITALGLAGDADAVRRTFDQACRAVEDVDPLDTIPESTARAYENALRLASEPDRRGSLR